LWAEKRRSGSAADSPMLSAVRGDGVWSRATKKGSQEGTEERGGGKLREWVGKRSGIVDRKNAVLKTVFVNSKQGGAWWKGKKIGKKTAGRTPGKSAVGSRRRNAKHRSQALVKSEVPN